jgi:hypothetical protein
MVRYQHYANGIEIKRAIGFGLANLSTAIKQAEIADISGFVDCHGADNACD